MNKLILENTLKDLDMAKDKFIKKILYDFLRYIKFLDYYKPIYDPDGSKVEIFIKYFKFEEDEHKMYCPCDDTTIKMIIIEVLISLPFEMHETRKKFRKYKNKFGFICNQEEKLKHKIWKIDAQHIIDDITYKDLSNLIMKYL